MRSLSGGFGLAILAALPLLPACLVDLGECNLDQAHEVVFLDTGSDVDSENGWPMYAGQAQVSSSCGNAQFCHSRTVTGVQRYGAPHGLDFDLTIACTDRDCDTRDPALALLQQSQDNVLDNAHLIYRTTRNGSMPPSGIGEDIVRRAPRFRRVPVQRAIYDLRTHTVPCDELPPGTCTAGETSKVFDNPWLPDVGSGAGNEILRNWLACGAPVVESTDEGGKEGSSCAVDELGHQGECIYRVDAPIPPLCKDLPPDTTLPCLEPTWSSLYNFVLYPRCGLSCHNPADSTNFGASGLTLANIDEAYDSMFMQPADGDSCDDSPLEWLLIDPGSPESSLLYEKMTQREPECGDPMPTGRGSISSVALEVLREWIAAGAPRN